MLFINSYLLCYLLIDMLKIICYVILIWARHLCFSKDIDEIEDTETFVNRYLIIILIIPFF